MVKVIPVNSKMFDIKNSSNFYLDLFFVLSNDTHFLPFIWVWLFGLFFVFSLELSLVFSSYFNTKHSYFSENKKNLFFTYFLSKLYLKNFYVTSFVKTYYKLYL